MGKITVIYGPQGSGKTSIAANLAGKQQTYKTSFDTIDDALRLSQVLNTKPQVIIIDECTIDQLESIVKLSNTKLFLIRNEISGRNKMKKPELIVVIQNSVSVQEVISAASGRNLNLIECKVKEVSNG